jgi:hypothetical protein
MQMSRKIAYESVLANWLEQVKETAEADTVVCHIPNLVTHLETSQAEHISRGKQNQDVIRSTLDTQLSELQLKKAAVEAEKRTFQPTFFLFESPHDKEHLILKSNSRLHLQKVFEDEIMVRKDKAVADREKQLEEEQRLVQRDVEAYHKDCEEKRLLKLQKLAQVCEQKADDDRINGIKRMVEHRRGRDNAQSLADAVKINFPEIVSPSGYRGMSIGFDSRSLAKRP